MIISAPNQNLANQYSSSIKGNNQSRYVPSFLFLLSLFFIRRRGKRIRTVKCTFFDCPNVTFSRFKSPKDMKNVKN